MLTIHYDPEFSDDERRDKLYGGDLIVYTPRTVTVEFAAFARALCEAAFGSLDPQQAQHSLAVEDYAAILSELKPRFIHHETSADFVRQIVREFGCNPEQSFYDVPRLRTSTSDDYLTSGIAFAWHPHRDTWYSAPPCQINWWMPVWPVRHDNTVCFYPHYFGEAIANDSENYNYYTHNAKHRGAHVAKMIKADPRAMPAPTEPIDLSREVRVTAPVGSIVLFSGAQLHASVRNTSGLTRFSVDFRTINDQDALAQLGAPAVDVKCGGSSIRDFRSVADGSRLPDSVVELFHDRDVEGGSLVFGDNTG
jgi:hypothetical protein